MSRISDRVQILMQERWRDSIPRPYRHDPNWWKRKTGIAHRGDIIAPMPDDGMLNAFWAEMARASGWSE